MSVRKKFLSIKSIKPKGIVHGFFTRNGGCSKKQFKSLNCSTSNGDSKYFVNKNTGRKIRVLIAVHVFGIPCKIIEIKKVCKKYNIKLIEDATEALGTFLNKKQKILFAL